MLKSQGVVSEDGTKIYSFGMWNCLETLTWQSEEDIQKLTEDRDPMEAPSCHYKVRIHTNVCFFIPISLLYCNQDLLYFFRFNQKIRVNLCGYQVHPEQESLQQVH